MDAKRQVIIRAFYASSVLCTDETSQSGDKQSGNDTPIPPSEQKENLPLLQDPGFRKFLFFVTVLFVGLFSFLWLVIIPEGEKAKMRKEMEHVASVKGPEVLEELLGEVRLLRLAVERLGDQ
jgi:hypothetical protein